MKDKNINRLISGEKYRFFYKDYDNFNRVSVGTVEHFNTCGSVVVLTDKNELFMFPCSSIRYMYPVKTNIQDNLIK